MLYVPIPSGSMVSISTEDEPVVFSSNFFDEKFDEIAKKGYVAEIANNSLTTEGNDDSGSSEGDGDSERSGGGGCFIETLQ